MASEVVPRVRPSARPRVRYILFEIDRPQGISRNAFVDALRKASDAVEPALRETLWLTRFDGHWGVLRVLRGDEHRGRRLIERGLAAAGVEARAVSTSGTLAALERRYGTVPSGQRRR